VVNLEACLRGVISAVNFGPPIDPHSTNVEITLRFP
jgi:hypothetical protein